MSKPTINIRLKFAGFVDLKMFTAEMDLCVPAGTSLKRLFALADKSGKLPPKAMKKVLALPRPPTVLLNGSAIDVAEDLSYELREGDEVAVMTPIGGG